MSGREAIESLYASDIVSVEAAAFPGQPAELKGKEQVKKKSQQWGENNTVHSAEVNGPYPHGDRFAVRFLYDITQKQSGKRMKMDEMALYAVKDGKIVREEFFYMT